MMVPHNFRAGTGVLGKLLACGLPAMVTCLLSVHVI
jgi:hypothetical protein